MNTTTDRRTTDTTTDDHDPTMRGPTRRHRTAGIVAVVGAVVAIVWGAIVVAGLAGEIDEMPRTTVPGEITLAIDEPGGYVVYHERDTWIATFPTDVDLDIEVTGPEGGSVAVNDYETTLTYRTPGLAGQAQATFDASVAGEHTVRVGSEAATGDTAVIGPSLAPSVLRGMSGPLVVFLTTLIAATVTVARAAVADRAASR